MVIQEYSVCPVPLYKYGQLPVSQLSPFGGKVSAEKLLSVKVRAKPSKVESKWRQRTERVLPWRVAGSEQVIWAAGAGRRSSTEHGNRRQPWHMTRSARGEEVKIHPHLNFPSCVHKNTGQNQKSKGRQHLYCCNLTFGTFQCFFTLVGEVQNNKTAS